jgi:hypothetical protein
VSFPIPNRLLLRSPNANASAHITAARAQTFRGYYVLLLGLMALLSILHFVLPNHAENVHSVAITPRIGYAFNADSALFAWTVITFPRGLATETGSVRRSRPLYSALGWVVYQPLRLMRIFVPKGIAAKASTLARQSNTGAIWRNIDGRQIVLAFVALIGVNLLISGTALFLIFRALRASFEPRLALFLTLIPAVHSDAIDFYLSPHTEPFNLLIPALFLSVVAAWSAGRDGFGWSTTLGVSMLAKPMPFMLPNWLVESVRRKRSSSVGHTNLPQTLPAGAIMLLLPTMLFLLFLSFSRIPLNNYEAVVHVPLHGNEANQYRMFVWMLDSIRAHDPGAIPVRIISGLVEHLRLSAIAFAIPLAICIVLLVVPKRRNFRLADEMWLHLIVYSCACSIFWACSGHIWKRLTITEFPLVIYALGCLSMLRSKRPEWIVSGAVVGSILTRVFGIY